jgi:hypothetical protein
MKILFTNNRLDQRAGSELYVRDVALALLRCGHEVAAYSTLLGSVATELQGAGVVVVDRLAALPWQPDVIHAQHHLETMTAILHFPGVPAVYVCHGFVPWEETPPLHPQIARYVAVDELTLEAGLRRHSVPLARSRLLLNFVDLGRFRPRSALPARPRRALLFSPHATPWFMYPGVLAGCRLRGVELDAVGIGMGNQTERPEDLLGGYDVVFAKGRSAIEAMACGAVAIVCGINGIGPLVDTKQFDRLRRVNFGAKSLMTKLTPEAVARQIDRYDASDAMRVTVRVRQEADLERAVEELLALYDEAITEFQSSSSDPLSACAASAAYLTGLASRHKQCHWEAALLRAELEHARCSIKARMMQMLAVAVWKLRPPRP